MLQDDEVRFAELLIMGTPVPQAAAIAEIDIGSGAVSVLLESKPFRAYLRARRNNELHTDLPALAMRVLRDLLTGKKVSNTVRLNTAKYVLSQAGHFAEADDADNRPLSDMNSRELALAIDSGMKTLAAISTKPEALDIPEAEFTEVYDKVEAVADTEDLLS